MTQTAPNTTLITSVSGRKKSVIISIRDHERMLEDLHDLAVVAERREEYPLSLAEMKLQLSGHAPL